MKNAIKFTPGMAANEQGGGGGVSPNAIVEVRTRDGVEADGTLRCFVLEVQDHGIGIPADVLPRIFQAFEQGGDDVSRTFGGLGLGLAIARSLAELHGGRLEAFSDGPGRGATFRLTLPGATERATVPAKFAGGGAAAPGERLATTGTPGQVGTTAATAVPNGAATPATAGTDGPPPRRLHILLVEDHEDTARAMAWLLKRGGHDVRVAHNVADAVALAAPPAHFDLLISDIGLPDGTGLDVIRQMPRRDIPAIALTGFGMEHDVARSLEAGFSEHLTKPVNFQKLEAVISTLSKG
jgi:CheY-like chemotaxis protein